MRLKVLPVAIALVSSLVWGGAASAASITVNNASFENPILADGVFNSSVTNWGCSGSCGTFNPTLAQIAAPPDGSNVAFSNGGYIEQITGLTALGVSYTLTAAVGDRVDTANLGSIQLVIGGTPINGVGVTPSGGWSDWTAFYPGGAAGQSIAIRLVSSGGDGIQGLFDNVRLVDSTTGSPAAVPEPMTLALLGTGLLGVVARSRKRKRTS
jgi:hypothetical protein